MPVSRQSRILVSWYCDPAYIPPFQLSPYQITTGPKSAAGDTIYNLFTPLGVAYDLHEIVRAQGMGGQFDAVVVFSDAAMTNRPRNLKAFGCPTILCVGDTHHLDQPLQKMIVYALGEDFDFVVSSYNRQHLHWFQEAGVKNTAWIPGLIARHVPRPFQHRHQQLAFVGQVGNFHPRRSPLFQAVRNAGIPLVAGTATRSDAAELYSRSVLSLNSALNGDLNLRNFEIMSAVGCLLTDRLSPESGWSLLFEEGKEYLSYRSVPELVEQAKHYLNHPHEALQIAKAGHRAYVNRFLPEAQIQKLLDWVFEQKTPEFNEAGWDYRPRLANQAPLPFLLRIQLYEAVQEAHRVQEQLQILVAPETPLSVVVDLLDLPRAQFFLLNAPVADRVLLEQFGLTDRVSYISYDEALRLGNWSFIIAVGNMNQTIRQIPHYKLILLPAPQHSNAAISAGQQAAQPENVTCV